MSEIEAILALKSAYFGNDVENGALKPYSVRLPLRQSAFIEVIAEQNNASRNEIITNLIKVGISEFISALGRDDPSAVEDLYMEVELHVRDELESLI